MFACSLTISGEVQASYEENSGCPNNLKLAGLSSIRSASVGFWGLLEMERFSAPHSSDANGTSLIFLFRPDLTLDGF
jgi:hypothetical protein